MTRLRAVRFGGPAGELEGLWKEAAPPKVGTAVFAHPHPLHGGTLHNKVVFHAARALAAAGYDTLRFNFRGVGASTGRHDQGVGETDDFRAAMQEAERRGGLPIVAGGFSFGSAVALRAIGGDRRVAAYVGIGLPVATEAGTWTRPAVPALFVVGENDPFGPPDLLRKIVRDAGQIVVIRDAGHFLEGRLAELEQAIAQFMASLPVGAAR